MWMEKMNLRLNLNGLAIWFRVSAGPVINVGHTTAKVVDRPIQAVDIS